MSEKKYFNVFTIKEYKQKSTGEIKPLYLKLGAAFPGKSESIHLVLDAIPAPDPKDGKYHLSCFLAKRQENPDEVKYWDEQLEDFEEEIPF